MGTRFDFFHQTGTGKRGCRPGFFPRRVTRDEDRVKFRPIPTPISARGLNLIPIPIGDGDFPPMWGRGYTALLPSLVALPLDLAIFDPTRTRPKV